MRIEIKLQNANYVIDVTGESYNVVKIGIIEDKNSKNYGNSKETTLGYCLNMGSALNTIIKNKMANEDEVISLNEYILRFQRYSEELKSFVTLSV